MKDFTVIIIGGGASGMMCALRLAESGVKNIALVERNERLGRKLSATGNGQGNVTNENMSSSHYFSSSGSVENILQRFGKSDLLQYLSRLGGLCAADETGRIYPTSRQASSITDLFRFAIAKAGIQVLTGETVREVRKEKKFIVHTQINDYRSDFLVLACGGKASPHFGSDGFGYKIAADFGHTIIPLHPSLVRIKTVQTDIRALKGIRVECEAELLRKDKSGREISVSSQRGDVLFTDIGVSGDLVFRMSAFSRSGDVLCLNFLPGFARKDIVEVLERKILNYPDMKSEDLLRGIVNSAIGRVILKRCGIAQSAEVCTFHNIVNKLTDMLQHFRLEISGNEGFENAQVTKGGVSMRELDDCLMSEKCDRLYIVGETVDVDGECGGYNLQWAFSSGAVAAEAIKDRINNVDGN